MMNSVCLAPLQTEERRVHEPQGSAIPQSESSKALLHFPVPCLYSSSYNLTSTDCDLH